MLKTRKIALYGRPGAGKSTSAGLLKSICEELGMKYYRIRLAEPLYEAQAAIYQIADRELASGTQDGELLNFLGLHMRKINPRVLLSRFEKRLNAIEEKLGEELGASIILCDDMRRSDVDFLESKEFELIRVQASAGTCRKRRSSRGDVTLGAEDHVTELGLEEIVATSVIKNEGSLEELEISLRELLRAGPE